MLLGVLGIWTLFALVVSVGAVLLRQRLKRWLWLILLILWSPWLLILLAVGLFIYGEHLRSAEIDRLTPAPELQSQLAEGFARDPRALLLDNETAVCLCHSYDASRCLSRELPSVAEGEGPSLPADDGMWYAIFLEDDALARIYLLNLGQMKAGCWQRAR